MAWASNSISFKSVSNKTESASSLVAFNNPAKAFVDCFNKNPCCDSWSKTGECKSNAPYMKIYCRVACGFCTPSFNVTNGIPNNKTIIFVFYRMHK